MSRVVREAKIYFCCSQMHQRPPRLVRAPWSPTSFPSFPSPLLRISLRTFSTWARHTRNFFLLATSIWLLLLLFLFFSFFSFFPFSYFPEHTDTLLTLGETFAPVSCSSRLSSQIAPHKATLHTIPRRLCTDRMHARRLSSGESRENAKVVQLGRLFFPSTHPISSLFFSSLFSRSHRAFEKSSFHCQPDNANVWQLFHHPSTERGFFREMRWRHARWREQQNNPGELPQHFPFSCHLNVSLPERRSPETRKRGCVGASREPRERGRHR